jgi:hypothetical protein
MIRRVQDYRFLTAGFLPLMLSLGLTLPLGPAHAQETEASKPAAAASPVQSASPSGRPDADSERGEAENAQPSASPGSEGAETSPAVEKLQPEAIAGAIQLDTLSVPTPGEVFAALEKSGQPTWPAEYRAPIPTAYPSRAQTALNVGGLIADGFIAVEAQDSQQVKNIGRDIITLAKSLGVSQNVLARGNSITEFAENNEWSALKEELEATQNEVKLAMEEQKDEALVTLVTIGAWLRGTEAVTSSISKNYSAEAAKLIRQPGLAGFLRGKLDKITGKLRDDPLIAVLRKRLETIETLVSIPVTEIPDKERVERLHAAAAEAVKEISTKPGGE